MAEDKYRKFARWTLDQGGVFPAWWPPISLLESGWPPDPKIPVAVDPATVVDGEEFWRLWRETQAEEDGGLRARGPKRSYATLARVTDLIRSGQAGIPMRDSWDVVKVEGRLLEAYQQRAIAYKLELGEAHKRRIEERAEEERRYAAAMKARMEQAEEDFRQMAESGPGKYVAKTLREEIASVSKAHPEFSDTVTATFGSPMPSERDLLGIMFFPGEDVYLPAMVEALMEDPHGKTEGMEHVLRGAVHVHEALFGPPGQDGKINFHVCNRGRALAEMITFVAEQVGSSVEDVRRIMARTDVREAMHNPTIGENVSLVPGRHKHDEARVDDDRIRAWRESHLPTDRDGAAAEAVAEDGATAAEGTTEGREGAALAEAPVGSVEGHACVPMDGSDEAEREAMRVALTAKLFSEEGMGLPTVEATDDSVVVTFDKSLPSRTDETVGRQLVALAAACPEDVAPRVTADVTWTPNDGEDGVPRRWRLDHGKPVSSPVSLDDSVVGGQEAVLLVKSELRALQSAGPVAVRAEEAEPVTDGGGRTWLRARDVMVPMDGTDDARRREIVGMLRDGTLAGDARCVVNAEWREEQVATNGPRAAEGFLSQGDDNWPEQALAQARERAKALATLADEEGGPVRQPLDLRLVTLDGTELLASGKHAIPLWLDEGGKRVADATVNGFVSRVWHGCVEQTPGLVRLHDGEGEDYVPEAPDEATRDEADRSTP